LFHSKPIIGLAGGIGSGKSYVARLFQNEGCLVLSADDAVTAAYQSPAVQDQLRQWWGPDAFLPTGHVNRPFIARRIFNDPAERQRLEDLLHPLVTAARTAQMEQAPADTRAFVWDVPLLFETDLHLACDAVVFVDAPLDQRLARVRLHRNWSDDELLRREKLQMPLDKKRAMAQYVVVNTAGTDDTRRQVQEVLTRILTTRTV
jgi:dephospho-CoA kinase